MVDVLFQLREACAQVSEQARHVRVAGDRVSAYAASLDGFAQSFEPDVHLPFAPAEELAAFWLTLDAINFGSGWFPTLHKAQGRSGYETIALGLRERFERHGPWAAEALTKLTALELATVFGQTPEHELMELFARSLRDLGGHLAEEHGGSFASAVDWADGSAVALVEHLARWDCFGDVSVYGALRVPFLKRAQITAADVHRAGVVAFTDLDRLTMFADNLVPHVLRLDGILTFDPELVVRIDREEQIVHDSPEEIEIRACAVHAVELIVAARPGSCAAEIDQLLWERGGGVRYKASPRHRSRCTAY
jgi:hypothetical protein